MSTIYRLGEVAKWSIGHPTGEHRYVDIEIELPTRDGQLSKRTETITLPTADAEQLVYSMTPSARHGRGMLKAVVDGMNSGDGLTHWNYAEFLVPLARWMRVLASQGTIWLGHSDCKYMMLRVDMRNGNFAVTDGSNTKRGEQALIEMIDMLVEERDRKEQREAAAQEPNTDA